MLLTWPFQTLIDSLLEVSSVQYIDDLLSAQKHISSLYLASAKFPACVVSVEA